MISSAGLYFESELSVAAFSVLMLSEFSVADSDSISFTVVSSTVLSSFFEAVLFPPLPPQAVKETAAKHTANMDAVIFNFVSKYFVIL